MIEQEEEQRKLSVEVMGTAGLKGGAGQTAEELLKVQHTTAVTAELQRMITDLEDPVHGEVILFENPPTISRYPSLS